jgi:hypothetical protein
MGVDMATRTKRSRGSATPKAKAAPKASATPKAPAAPKASAKPKAPKATETPKAPKAPKALKAQTAPEPPQAQHRVPAALKLAAVAQAVEAVGLLVAAVFAAVATADGRSLKLSNGIALTAIAFVAAVGLAPIAAGLARAQPWSRTPTAMTQLFVIIAGIALLDASRLDWGVPALVLAGVCLAGLVTPASFRALNRTDLDSPGRKSPDPKSPDPKSPDPKSPEIESPEIQSPEIRRQQR